MNPHYSHSICSSAFSRFELVSELIGKPKCFGSSTVAHEKLFCAKALIEVSSDKPLPSSIRVKVLLVRLLRCELGMAGPDICISCHSFRHVLEHCRLFSSSDMLPPPKVPLLRPLARRRVPKVVVEPVRLFFLLVKPIK